MSSARDGSAPFCGTPFRASFEDAAGRDGVDFTGLPSCSQVVSLEAEVNLDEALRYLKYRGQTLDDSIVSQMQAAKDMCEKLTPKGVVRMFQVAHNTSRSSCSDSQSEQSVRLVGSDLVLSGKGITKFVGSAPLVALIAVTLGTESERMLKREQALGALSGILVDACASSYVESATDDLQSRLSKMLADSDMVADARFSPGYGDFSLSVQSRFIREISADKLLGITVTESDMLIPTKSVTAVVRLTSTGSNRGQRRD